MTEIDSEVVIAGTAGSVKEAVNWLKQNEQPDVILADIELGDGQCFNIFRQINIISEVVFITSFDESTMRVFKSNNLEYLLKPIKKHDLGRVIQKLRSGSNTSDSRINIEKLIQEFKTQEHHKNYRNRLLVKHGHTILAIETEEIAYIYMDRKFSYVKTWDGETYSIRHSLDELEEMLQPKHFSRINENYIINSRSIAHVHQNNGSVKLIL